jgi:hypothetical protein
VGTSSVAGVAVVAYVEYSAPEFRIPVEFRYDSGTLYPEDSC